MQELIWLSDSFVLARIKMVIRKMLKVVVILSLLYIGRLALTWPLVNFPLPISVGMYQRSKQTIKYANF